MCIRDSASGIADAPPRLCTSGPARRDLALARSRPSAPGAIEPRGSRAAWLRTASLVRLRSGARADADGPERYLPRFVRPHPEPTPGIAVVFRLSRRGGPCGLREFFVMSAAAEYSRF